MYGNIITVNVSKLRSDAIIISSGSIKTLALPKLSASTAKRWISNDWRGGRSERATKNKQYREYLRWLWDGAVKNIIAAIGLLENAPTGCLQRVWWIGSGLASSMPFHAAGIHAPGSRENAFCYVISPYAPSIKALNHSRSRSYDRYETQLRILVATMLVTPGLKSLSGINREREDIAQVPKDYATIEEIEQPGAEEVTQRLKECNIAHFACHGRTDSTDPSNSGLIFARRDESGNLVQDPLTMHEVSQTNLQHARLAYLSACSTAENKASRLADEAIHVVAGFQVAGFPHVIGCLWLSLDRVCVDIAHDFYLSLTEHGRLDLGSRAIAEALHRSTLAVVAREWKRPLDWAQFVHFGA
jgi:hypothetical protein